MCHLIPSQNMIPSKIPVKILRRQLTRATTARLRSDGLRHLQVRAPGPRPLAHSKEVALELACSKDANARAYCVSCNRYHINSISVPPLTATPLVAAHDRAMGVHQRPKTNPTLAGRPRPHLQHIFFGFYVFFTAAPATYCTTTQIYLRLEACTMRTLRKQKQRMHDASFSLLFFDFFVPFLFACCATHFLSSTLNPILMPTSSEAANIKPKHRLGRHGPLPRVLQPAPAAHERSHDQTCHSSS